MEKAVCGGFYYDSSLVFTKTFDGHKILKAKPSMEKVAPYLYEIEYGTYDYRDGQKYVEQYKSSAMCSAIRKDNIIGRNFDWYYGDEAQFVVRTKAIQGRHATIGVANSKLSDTLCNSGEWDDFYNALPFLVGDCINDKGVYVNINIVSSGDKGHTIGTNTKGQDLCQIMIPRYLCDYAESAKDAITLLQGMNIHAPKNDNTLECHVLICDEQDNYIVEFIDNQMVVFSNTDENYESIPNNHTILTNFYLHGWNGEIKSVSMGDSAKEVEVTGLNKHAMGLERYNIILEEIDNIINENDMQELMERLKYTNAYNINQNPFWYSEFNNGNLTIYSDAEDYRTVVEKAIEYYQQGIRDKIIWYTAHTSIYNIVDKKLSVFVNEDYEHKYEFKLHIAGQLD